VASEPVPPDGDHAYVYPPAPPLAVTDADPFALPHVAAVADITSEIAEGCVMLNVCVIVHPFASVAVAVYTPTQRPVAFALVPPVGDHE
jgi:hypothetical protein